MAQCLGNHEDLGKARQMPVVSLFDFGSHRKSLRHDSISGQGTCISTQYQAHWPHKSPKPLVLAMLSNENLRDAGKHVQWFILEKCVKLRRRAFFLTTCPGGGF
jgi:hypothetical protein